MRIWRTRDRKVTEKQRECRVQGEGGEPEYRKIMEKAKKQGERRELRRTGRSRRKRRNMGTVKT